MNKKRQKEFFRETEAWQNHCKRYNESQLKRLEREADNIRRKAEKRLNSEGQIVRQSSEAEIKRIELSKLPKQKQEISDIRAYRKTRAKKRK
jgi:hypothetical protein